MDPELRVYLDQRFEVLDQRFDLMDRRLEGVDRRLEGVDRRLEGVDRRLEGVDRRLEGVDRRFVELESELRRHFGVLTEQTRRELQTVAEMVVANTEAIASIRVRLDARSL